MQIHAATYLISSPSIDKCPPPDKPEFAFLGRSNVGKSSLINMVTDHKGLAKISSTPGKTQLINHFEVRSADKKGKGFSASSISTYIFCPLKFYFENIAKLKKQDDIKIIDQMMFGRILHKAMELIYENQKDISQEFFNNSLQQIEKVVLEATNEEYTDKELIGNDYLLQGVIKELIRRILQIDQNEKNIKIISIEDDFSHEFNLDATNRVFIKGVFDRLDLVNNQIRILFYKKKLFK